MLIQGSPTTAFQLVDVPSFVMRGAPLNEDFMSPQTTSSASHQVSMCELLLWVICISMTVVMVSVWYLCDCGDGISMTVMMVLAWYPCDCGDGISNMSCGD